MKKYVYIIFITTVGLLSYGCEPTQLPTEPSYILGFNTVIIDDNTGLLVEHLYASEVIFNGNSEQLQNLSVGDIIISGTASNAPHGFLRKITSISHVGTRYYCDTEDASFTQAFQELHFDYTRDISLADTATITTTDLLIQKSTTDLTFTIPLANIIIFDYDHNISTTFDQVKLNGAATLTASIHNKLDIKDYDLKYAKLEAIFKPTLNLALTIGSSLPVINETVKIWEKPIGSYPIPGLPFIKIKPTLRINVGAVGSCNVNIAACYTHISTLSTWIEYDGNSWHADYSKTPPADSYTGTINGNASLKVFVEPGVDFSFYGAPFATAGIGTQAYVKLTGNLLPSLTCSAKAGVAGNASAKLKIYNWTLGTASYPDIFDYSYVLDSCIAPSPCGTVTDIDGNIYQTVQIGTQCWMVENLKVTKYRNGDPIPYVSNINTWSGLTYGAFCYYDNLPSNGATYGGLYNWYSVNDIRNIAPVGWHIPDSAEMIVLSTYLGGASVAGGKMKVTSSNNPPWDGSNISGFSALPGGYITEYLLSGSWGIGGIFNMWCTTGINSTHARGYNINSGSSTIMSGMQPKVRGFSIRCIKD